MYLHMSKPLAIFDLDGTLVETDAANSCAWLETLRRAGLDGNLPVKGAGRLTKRVIACALPSLSAADLVSLAQRKASSQTRFLPLTRLGPAADDFRFVLAHRSDFAKIVLLTDAQERRALETLHFHGLVRCFDEIFCNGGKGDKYANYFAAHDADPRFCRVWENAADKVSAAFAAGVPYDFMRKVA